MGLTRRSCLAGLLFPCITSEALSVKKARGVALVIGNAAYADAPLRNTLNDANAMGSVLSNAGYSVISLRDADRGQMLAAITQAKQMLVTSPGVALFFYAGHAMQLGWKNWMLPINASPSSAADVTRMAVDVQQVVEAFQSAGSRHKVVVLDACRDNPFASIASGQGLSPVNAPAGTFFAFATAPGHVADDGSVTNQHSPYTAALLAELGVDGTRIEDLFKRVRLKVRQISEGRQIPWESTSLEDDIYLTGTAPLRDPALELVELQAELSQWEATRRSTNIEDFFMFLRRYPNGYLSEQAQFRLDQLQQPRIQPASGANGITQLPSGLRRFRIGDVFVFDVVNGRTNYRRRTVRRVTAADDGRVVINDGELVYDAMGGVLSDRFGTKSPAIVEVPADLALGKTWRSAHIVTSLTTGLAQSTVWHARTVALESVRVPAGEIKAYRIEREGSNGSGSVMRSTLWIDPTVMHIVKRVVLHRDGKGNVTENFSMELVRYEKST